MKIPILGVGESVAESVVSEKSEITRWRATCLAYR